MSCRGTPTPRHTAIPRSDLLQQRSLATLGPVQRSCVGRGATRRRSREYSWATRARCCAALLRRSCDGRSAELDIFEPRAAGPVAQSSTGSRRRPRNSTCCGGSLRSRRCSPTPAPQSPAGWPRPVAQVPCPFAARALGRRDVCPRSPSPLVAMPSIGRDLVSKVPWPLAARASLAGDLAPGPRLTRRHCASKETPALS